MRNIFAIARLTFSEGIRMKIVLVFLLVLVFVMLRMPFTLRGDETLAGRLQTFLEYSLGAVGVLLSMACVFLSCSTLTSEIKSNVIHLVIAKPVSRLQILAGKWLGINLLMILLVLLCGLTIYGFARFIKAHPASFQRDEINVRDVVWRARVAAMPTPPASLEDEAREWVSSQMKQGQDFSRGEEVAVKDRMRHLENAWRSIPPNHGRVYFFDNLIAPRAAEEAVQVRYRARGIPLPASQQVPINFTFADPDTNQQISGWHRAKERSSELHQFLVRGQAVIKDGRSAIGVANPLMPPERSVIHFEGEDWLQILYNVGTFEENYTKTLLIIMARLAFLSAIGLFFSVFVSFPVACLCAFTFYLVCLGMPFWLEAIGANLEFRTDDIDPFGSFGPLARLLLVPLMKFVFPNFALYDGARHLIAGEYISAALLIKSLAHTLAYGAILLFLPGWLIFRSREIAEVTI
ncbi:MAG: ABC transporter permease subunit [Planctomycetota bacterium]